MASVHPEAHRATAPLALDHVALWVGDRDAMAAFLCNHLGMQELERTEKFTLLGADARRGKLSLFPAEGPRDPGALLRVVLRVADLERALASLPASLEVERPVPETAVFEGPEGLGLGLTSVMGGGVDYDLDHVVLRVDDPDEATVALTELGFVPRGGALHVGDKQLRLEEDPALARERPLLNHIGLLVESVEAVEVQARQRGLEVEELADASNTVAVFVRGPERIRLEYIQARPTSLLS